jgi:hypothetical protein
LTQSSFVQGNCIVAGASSEYTWNAGSSKNTVIKLTHFRQEILLISWINEFIVSYGIIIANRIYPQTGPIEFTEYGKIQVIKLCHSAGKQSTRQSKHLLILTSDYYLLSITSATIETDFNMNNEAKAFTKMFR